MRLSGKTALVTGGARGQGEQEARLFASEGAQVIIGDVLDGSALAAEIGARYVQLDVSDEASWKQIDEPLDVLVNNAAILRFGKLGEMTPDEYMAVVRVNQLGCFLGLSAAARLMRDGGSVVNIASIEAISALPMGTSAYAATKGAILSMTRVAAVELGRRGIRVNAVLPGGVDTPMGRPPGVTLDDMAPLFKRTPLGRVSRPEEIAKLVLFLASDESSYCTGAQFVADGGATIRSILG